ncbi:hypothetical protein GCM10010171_28570 [Actinokineospora fastidiosa]|uniref:Uncharacterized protein n=1 Tax=Actinokineospora fastidiosa TaxID=1816 RepID=A0A918GHF7_9PSEU|nr:hypothetical protein GCM10010171_28570 [Actinokineospora fastidiosa]
MAGKPDPIPETCPSGEDAFDQEQRRNGEPTTKPRKAKGQRRQETEGKTGHQATEDR